MLNVGVVRHLRDSVIYGSSTMVIGEISSFSSYQRYGKYYELSMCFLVVHWDVFGPCVSLFVAIIGRDSLVITSSWYIQFTLRSQGAYLSVATVKIVLSRVLQLQSIVKHLLVLSESGTDYCQKGE